MQETVLEPIAVMCVRAEGGLKRIPSAWSTLHSKLSSLTGRKFYGTFDHADESYRACVAMQPGDSPEQLGFDVWTIPGGRYAERKLVNWRQNVGRIGAIFQEMERESTPDNTRPSIELYRSEEEVTLYHHTIRSNRCSGID